MTKSTEKDTIKKCKKCKNCTKNQCTCEQTKNDEPFRKVPNGKTQLFG